MVMMEVGTVVVVVLVSCSALARCAERHECTSAGAEQQACIAATRGETIGRGGGGGEERWR